MSKTAFTFFFVPHLSKRFMWGTFTLDFWIFGVALTSCRGYHNLLHFSIESPPSSSWRHHLCSTTDVNRWNVEGNRRCATAMWACNPMHRRKIPLRWLKSSLVNFGFFVLLMVQKEIRRSTTWNEENPVEPFELFWGWTSQLRLMVQKSHSQPPGMVLKTLVNKGRNYRSLNWFSRQIEPGPISSDLGWRLMQCGKLGFD